MAFFKIFFHKNNLLSYRKSYQYSHIMLHHFEKSWNGAQSLFGEKTISKIQVVRWRTPHCFLRVDAFRYFLGWNSWRNPNLLSFDVFEEKPRFEFARFSATNRWKFWQVRLCCSWWPIQPISTLFRAFWDDERWSNGPHWNLRPAFWLSSYRPLPRLAKVPGRRNLIVNLFCLHLRGLYRKIWTSWTIFQLGFCWLFLRQKVRWDREMTVLHSNLSRSGRV